MNFIPGTIIRALCWTLLHSLWQGLILAIVAGAVMLLTKKARSSARYSLLAVLLGGFLMVSGYTFFHELRTPVVAISRLAPGAAPVISNFGNPAAGPSDNAVPAAGIGQMIQYFNTHAAMVVVLWFIVALARFVKVFSGVVYAQRIRHYGTYPVPAEWQARLTALLQRLKINRPVRLLESALIKVPATVGWLKPVILVPAGMLIRLSPDQVESILLHELAHISRRDYLFNLVQHLVDTLFFFNPALLWVSSLIRTERENCCDDVAIRETRSRRMLIQALVSFHEYQQWAGGNAVVNGYALGFANENKNSMIKRVERIVHKRNHSLNAGERLLLMGGVLLLCGAFITVNSGRAGVSGDPIKVKTNVGQKVETSTPVKMTVATVGVTQMKKTVTTRRNVIIRMDTTKPETTKPDTAKLATLTKADIDLLIEAHDHGVTTEYVAQLKQMGYNVSLKQAINLMDHGVSVDFMRAIQKEGYGTVPLEMAITLMDHGVSAEFIRQVKAEGFPNLTLADAVNLVDHGVDIEFIRHWKKKTDSKLVLSDYIKLRDAGIEPS